MVIVNGPQMLDEVRKRPDEELSFIESTEDVSRTIPTRPITDFDLAAARLGCARRSSCKSGTSSDASPTTTRITSTSSGTSSRGRFPRSSRTWSTRSGLPCPSIFRPTRTVRALRVSYFRSVKFADRGFKRPTCGDDRMDDCGCDQDYAEDRGAPQQSCVRRTPNMSVLHTYLSLSLGGV